MTIRRTRFSRRGIAAVALAAGLALGVTGCGSDSPAPPKEEKTSSENKEAGEQPDVEEVPGSDEVLVRVEGPDGMVMTLNSVVRDSSGFVTVNGHLKNTTDEDYFGMADWSGNEEEIVKHGASLGGATLIDKAGKKRYYVLRDTEGRPLATTFTGGLDGGANVPIFAQFPAPPESTTKVDFQLPGWPSAPVEITE